MKQLKLQKIKPTIPFTAKLSETNLPLPKNVILKLPKEKRIIVEGIINSFPFRATIETKVKEQFLKISKPTLTAINASTGDKIKVEITRVEDESETRMPTDLQKALRAQMQAKIGWEDITPIARRDWIFSICSAKFIETRKRRIEKACSMLSSGKRRLCCFPGIKWMTKDYVKPKETWQPLRKQKKI